jgi:uncharacterized protein YggU (UPF0235/DUF167 family)
MLISCQVTPKSRGNKVIEIDKTNYQIKTTAAAADNQANLAVIKQLAAHLKIKKSQIFLKTGQTSRHKIFEVLL